MAAENPSGGTENQAPPVFVVSGGVGASGEQLVRTALAQFSGANVPLEIVGRVRQVEQLQEVVGRAAASGGTIVHTMVDPDRRQKLVDLAAEQGVVAIDVMGPLLARLQEVLGEKPAGQPGLYRIFNKAYFDRVEAINFAVAHDDGQRPADLPQAEVVLIGVSRVGKTPLSMYLSILGWKAANVPFVQESLLPPELSAVDPHKVVGLTIEPSELLARRQWRQRGMGASATLSYAQPADLYAEMEATRRFYRRHGFHILDVTEKPLETSAEEIISLITRKKPVT